MKSTSMTSELLIKCLEVENCVRLLVMQGADVKEIVNHINKTYKPKTIDEMEVYSEAAVYAYLGVLN
jgi:hypothetical protein